ncbi:MAG: HPr family phosphocarrier protein [Succinivibrio sp.]
MKQLTYTIKDRDGVHARPAGAIIKAIAGYDSKVTIDFKGKKVDLKSGIFAFLGLGIRFQDEVTVTVEGEDEEEAFNGVTHAFNEYL